MKKSIRSFQAGRSMIEVIAIVAIMGILLIAGLVGFKLLLDYFKQKETVEQVTTIGMRYKASRLNAKTPQQGYVPMNQVFPEGENCNSNPECVITPEGGQVKLYSMGESKNFVVLVSNLKSTSCEELAMMGGYEFAFTPSTFPSDDNNVLNEISEIIQGNDEGTQRAFSFSDEGIFGAEGKTIALTPEYIKKNPTVLKTFCDPDLPLLGFVYSADEDCDYFYDGACHDCPKGQVQDSTGECCSQTVLDNEANCGLCDGCKDKICLEDEQRCVECTTDDDCTDNPNGNICIDNHCVQCNGANGCTDNNMCCNAKHECIEINANFWTRNENGSCICKDVELGGQCEADCNCAHLGATFKCMNVGENTVKTCAKDPNGCETNEDCGGNRVCCKQENQSYGVCCNEGEFCKEGVCSKCTENNDCGEEKTCCNGACYSEMVETCGDECCTEGQQCLTDENGKGYCGNDENTCNNLGLTYCESEGDCCEVGYYCHETLGCVECSEQPIKTCDASVPAPFNSSCLEKKYLNCLDETDTKSDDDLREMIEDNDITPPEETPICAGESETTDARCGECSADTQCAQLRGKGAENVLNPKYVCRSGHTGADEKYNGTCGKCIKSSDCDNGLPCIDGMCGCETDADCDANCDGRTTCDETTHTCVCGTGLIEDGDGGCVCPTSIDIMYRLLNGNGAQYKCCPPDTYPYNGECRPLCGEDNPKITQIQIYVDHSYSTIVGTTEIAENIENARQIIHDLIEEANLNITITEQTEYTGDATSVQKEIKGKNISFTPFNCGGSGRTCFIDSTGEIPRPTSAGTLVFILSDGVLPEKTTKNLDSDYTYVFANEETSWEGMKEEHIIPFENLDSDDLEERFFGIIDSSICVYKEEYQNQLYADCIQQENP